LLARKFVRIRILQTSEGTVFGGFLVVIDRLDDEYYMRLALELAAKARGQTGVNPVVGCVIVKAGRIVGLGSHLRRGEAHAEIHALKMAGEEARGATVYVTLEPCSHYGRTPPCADRLIEAGVGRVVAAATDPNPRVSGTGLRKLEAAGIDTASGVLEAESRRLNEAYEKYIRTGMPFVTLKAGSTLDGRLSAGSGDSRWVTGEDSRSGAHTLRHWHDGIMIGAGTALKDDPSLTTRTPAPGLHPTRIVVDSRLKLPPHLKLFTDGQAPTIVLAAADADSGKRRELEAAGVEVIGCAAAEGHIDLRDAMRKLGEREIGSVLLEGGGKLNGAMLEAGLVDKIVVFFAPKIVGSGGTPLFDHPVAGRMAEAIKLARIEIERYGDDWCVTGYPERPAQGGE
jgi:diaminohydroxyphosphoribosylaminopyrimidine deaminase/5-amino-6-(5-phosphoribosylamino)uracil reductase